MHYFSFIIASARLNQQVSGKTLTHEDYLLWVFWLVVFFVGGVFGFGEVCFYFMLLSIKLLLLHCDCGGEG